MGFIGERNPFGGSYETPNMDLNYGVGSRIQLKYEVPLSIEEMRGDTRHVAALLDSRTGSSPKLHDWYLDADGRYWLHLPELRTGAFVS